MFDVDISVDIYQRVLILDSFSLMLTRYLTAGMNIERRGMPRRWSQPYIRMI